MEASTGLRLGVGSSAQMSTGNAVESVPDVFSPYLAAKRLPIRARPC